MERPFEPPKPSDGELTTVNDQLQRRNAELGVVNNDLTNLLASSGIPVAMVSRDLRLQHISGPVWRAMNILPTDLGRQLRDLSIGRAVPDLVAVVEEVMEQVRTVEREVIDREGRWFLMRVHPYRATDDKVDGAVIVMLELDQMRHTQIELQEKTQLLHQQGQLMELSQDAIIVRDAENRIQSWNSGAQEMYGWGAEEVLGLPLEEVLKTDREAWLSLNLELERTGFWEGELHQSHRDGTPIIIHSREVLVRDEHGQRSAVLSIKRDITELRRVIQALHEADRRKDEFLATLAHELRNPLAPVRNAVEIMRIAGDNPATVARVRDMLDRQVQQLSRIVDDLIDVTRIVEKKIDLRREQVPLTQVVDTALETCRSRIEGRRQRLSVSVPVAPIIVDVDPVRMSQVLINLLDNASKYTDAGGQIWLSAEPQAGGNGSDHPSVAIRVRDTGIGIPPEVLPDVFDMFTQGARTREQGRGGLGVGLALVRSLVEMHSGVITAESEGVGKGSEFVVRLPVSDDSAAARAHPARPARDAVPGPVRILVVDDSQDHAETLGMLLRLMGHEVQLAASGPEALEGVARFEPDVALVDIGLPGMNGYDVARRIREQPKYRGMVLVAQTGWGQTEDRIRSKEAGFDFHLVKPVDRDALEAILRDVRPA